MCFFCAVAETAGWVRRGSCGTTRAGMALTGLISEVGALMAVKRLCFPAFACDSRHGAVYILLCHTPMMAPESCSPALVLRPVSADCRELHHRPNTFQGFCSVGCHLPPQPFPSQQPVTARVLYHRTYTTTTRNSLCTSVSRGHSVSQPNTKGLHRAHRDGMSSRTSVSAPERVRKRVAEACAFCRRRKVCTTPLPLMQPQLTRADQVQRGKAIVRGMQDIQQGLQLRGRP